MVRVVGMDVTVGWGPLALMWLWGWAYQIKCGGVLSCTRLGPKSGAGIEDQGFLDWVGLGGVYSHKDGGGDKVFWSRCGGRIGLSA